MEKKQRSCFVSLPEELIVEILIRIPATYLIKFKSVCKLWKFLISDHKFAKANLTHSQQEVFVQKPIRDKEGAHYYSINIQENHPEKLEVFLKDDLYLGSSVITCDGLLLLQHKLDWKKLYIFNPVTRICVPLPQLQDNWGDLFLVRDDSIGKYKIFVFCKTGNNSRVDDSRCYVLTQGRHVWRELETHIEDAVESQNSVPSAIAVDKELHWLTEIMYKGQQQSFYYVSSLDVATEKSTLTKVPSEISSKHKNNYMLMEVRGSLSVISLFNVDFDIWILEDRSNSLWTKYYSTNLYQLSNITTLLESFVSSKVRFLGTKYSSANTFLELLKIVIVHEDCLFVYDLKSQNLREVALLNEDERLSPLHEFHYSSLVRWE